MLPRSPSFRLDGKRAVVTGGSRGIGLGCAVALAEQGANVVIVARSKDQVFETVNKMKSKGFSVSGTPMDITNIDSVKNLMASLKFLLFYIFPIFEEVSKIFVHLKEVFQEFC